MVSYRYDLAEVDENHDRFLSDGRITATRQMLRLLN
jgi:hypothetical protein